MEEEDLLDNSRLLDSSRLLDHSGLLDSIRLLDKPSDQNKRPEEYVFKKSRGENSIRQTNKPRIVNKHRLLAPDY